MARRGRTLGLGVALVASLGVPASAQAATFCVADPACVMNGGTAKATIADAFSDAAGVAGKDRVEVGPGTFDGASAAVGNAIELIGEGSSGATATTISQAGAQASLLSLDAATSSVSGLRLVLDDADTIALSNGGTATDIDVTGSSTGAETGVRLFVGSILRDSRIVLAEKHEQPELRPPRRQVARRARGSAVEGFERQLVLAILQPHEGHRIVGFGIQLRRIGE